MTAAALKKDFNMEYAKSGRSTCRGCEEKIAKVIYAVAMATYPTAEISCSIYLYHTDAGGFCEYCVKLKH